jgi:hypothetical protein
MNTPLSCRNLLCRLNKSGACDAEDMVNLMCSGLDLYNQCQERKDGEELMASLEKIFGKKFIKNSKGEVGYAD